MYAVICANIICKNAFAIFEQYVQKFGENSEFIFLS